MCPWVEEKPGTEKWPFTERFKKPRVWKRRNLVSTYLVNLNGLLGSGIPHPEIPTHKIPIPEVPTLKIPIPEIPITQIPIPKISGFWILGLGFRYLNRGAFQISLQKNWVLLGTLLSRPCEKLPEARIILRGLKLLWILSFSSFSACPLSILACSAAKVNSPRDAALTSPFSIPMKAPGNYSESFDARIILRLSVQRRPLLCKATTTESGKYDTENNIDFRSKFSPSSRRTR